MDCDELDIDDLGFVLLENVSNVETDSISTCKSRFGWKERRCYIHVTYDFAEEPIDRTITYVLHWDSGNGFHWEEHSRGELDG